MNIVINRLNPNVPDPVESRRRAAGRLVRTVYAASVFGVLGFFVIYFGAPLVFLNGPGTVSSARRVVSLPYIVQISSMNVLPGAAVKAGDEIAQVHSPEHNNIVATYMRALADVASRIADLRVKIKVAQDSLENSRTYKKLTEDIADNLTGSEHASMAFQLEVFRERAASRKALVTQEAEISESNAQLGELGQFGKQLREHLDDVERQFAGGRVASPMSGIISTNVAQVGQSLVAGTPIAEILDPTDVFVDWYIPNARLIEPEIGNDVFVVFGNVRFVSKISEILRVSDVFSPTQASVIRDRTATQIARIRLNADAKPPALNSTVQVHMFYSEIAERLARGLSRLLGILRS
jgi:hypothetical protein